METGSRFVAADSEQSDCFPSIENHQALALVNLHTLVYSLFLKGV